MLVDPVADDILYNNFLLDAKITENKNRTNGLFNFIALKSSPTMNQESEIHANIDLMIPAIHNDVPFISLNNFEQTNIEQALEKFIEPVAENTISKNVKINEEFAENSNRAISLFNFNTKNLPIKSSDIENDYDIHSKII